MNGKGIVMRYTDIPGRNNSLFPFCFFDGVEIGEEMVPSYQDQVTMD